MFVITFFPARYGDSIWITYGSEDAPRHILIDGGTAGTKSSIIKKLQGLEEAGQQLELVVVSHIDRDHIEGILDIYEHYGGKIKTKDFWFNGWKHLPSEEGIEDFGPEQGERLSSFLELTETPWNCHFNQEAVCVAENDPLPEIKLEGSMKLTLLSPYKEHLLALKKVWSREILKAGLTPGDVPVEVPEEGGGWEAFGPDISVDVETLAKSEFNEDDAEANGSSIAFLLEYEGFSVLLAADAHPNVISRSLDKITSAPVAFDVFKLSHHGSKGNTSPELFKKVLADKYVISTNGANYKHPDQETIARLLKINDKPKSLVFNYRTKFNEPWDNSLLKNKYDYTTEFGDSTNGITIQLI